MATTHRPPAQQAQERGSGPRGYDRHQAALAGLSGLMDLIANHPEQLRGLLDNAASPAQQDPCNAPRRHGPHETLSQRAHAPRRVARARPSRAGRRPEPGTVAVFGKDLPDTDGRWQLLRGAVQVAAILAQLRVPPTADRNASAIALQLAGYWVHSWRAVDAAQHRRRAAQLGLG